MEKASRRVGRFSITLTLLNDESCHPELMAIMGQFIVFSAECVYLTGAVEYTAISKHFKSIDEGDSIPYYLIKYDPEGGVICEEIKK